MAPVASITRKQAPNWRVATIRTSIVGLRRLISHGIISTKASAQTIATVVIKDEPNQSSSSPRSSTISSAPRKVATSTKPTRSNPPPCCRQLSALRDRGLGLAQDQRDQREREHADRAVDQKGTSARRNCRPASRRASARPPAPPPPRRRTARSPGRASPAGRHPPGSTARPAPCRRRRDPAGCGTAASTANSRHRPHSTELAVNSARQMRKKVLRPSRRARKLLAVKDDGVGDQIGRDDPGRLVLAHAQAAGDVMQHHVGDRRVEHLHERCERDQNGDQPWVGADAPLPFPPPHAGQGQGGGGSARSDCGGAHSQPRRR